MKLVFIKLKVYALVNHSLDVNLAELPLTEPKLTSLDILLVILPLSNLVLQKRDLFPVQFLFGLAVIDLVQVLDKVAHFHAGFDLGFQGLLLCLGFSLFGLDNFLGLL